MTQPRSRSAGFVPPRRSSLFPALGWLLHKADWIVPIPGTTKLSHLEENIRAASLAVSPEEWQELEAAIAAVEIMGDRYPADQQKQVQSS